MRAIINFFKKQWVIQLIGIIALTLLIWFLAPYVTIKDKEPPLESETARLIAIIVLLFLWGLNILRLQSKAARANNEMAKDLSANSKPEQQVEEEVDSEANEEVSILSKNFDYALETLKSSSKHKRGKQYLYELPWYVIIGPSGSGKTTALLNSGLEFPLAERFGHSSIQGVGGTRNCDWWFTEQAVFLDTAGNYTTQDSHQAVDKAAWHGFLDLLKKHRPRRPVNGILVSMSLSDLMRMTETERGLHAKAVRQRVHELYEQFGVRFPVYMLLTKADIIAGFNDFFADLSREERGQVWGVTFPEEEEQGINQSDVTLRIPKDFDDLLERLNTRLAQRIQDERDVQRRALIFGFPQRMALLKEPVTSFMRESFGANRYQAAPMLRGMYIISSTQEGTPIDKLTGLLSQTFKLDKLPAASFSGHGRSYFVNRLFKEVVFTEAELVGANKKVEKRRVLIQRIAYATAASLAVGLSLLWAHSHSKNKDALTELDGDIAHYKEVEKKYWDWQKDFESLLKQMDALYELTVVYPPEDDIPWDMRYGLYQGEKYQPLADSTYHKILLTHFLPMIQARLERRMQTAEGENLEVLYELLKVYLMLGDPEKIQQELVAPWIEIDWQNNYQPAIQFRLSQHLARLLQLKLPKMGLNEEIITETRQKLTQIPLAQQIYLRIKSRNAVNRQYDFRLADALGKKGSRVFTVKNGSYNLQRIPGLFTYDGFHQIFLDESKQAAKETMAQQWVYGKPDVSDRQVLKKLEEQIHQYYFNDYNQYWDELIANLQIRDTRSLEQSVEILEAVSGIDSPLDKLLNTVAVQSNLTKMPEDEALTAEKLEKGEKTAKAIPNAKMQQLLKVAKAAGEKSQFAKVPGKEVETHFAQLAALVAKSDGGTSTMEQVTADLGDLYNFMSDMGNASNPDAAAAKLLTAQAAGDGNDVVARLKKQAVRLPEPVKTWVNTLAKGNWSIVLGGVSEQLNTSFQADVGNVCASSMEGRYPMDKSSSEEIALPDFAKFFGPKGVLDQFFQDNLKELVDTTTPRWSLLPQESQSIQVSQEIIDQFQSAANIRKMFFQGDNEIPTIKFELKPVFLDAKVAKFWLDIEGQTLSYRHGPLRASNLTWPGTRPGSVRFGFETLDGRSLSRSESGSWAWFRMLDSIDIQQQAWDQYLLTFDIDGFTARYEMRANSVLNPFSSNELQKFSCATPPV